MSDLCIFEGYNPSNDYEGYRKASRSDVLEWLGWEKCETCGGKGVAYEVPGHLRWHRAPCPDCLQGLVPPASQVEAAAQAIAEVMYEPPYVGRFSRMAARAALIAAFREGVGDE